MLLLRFPWFILYMLLCRAWYKCEPTVSAERIWGWI